MAEGRHFNTGGEPERPAGRDDMDWLDLDWLNETPDLTTSRTGPSQSAQPKAPAPQDRPRQTRREPKDDYFDDDDWDLTPPTQPVRQQRPAQQQPPRQQRPAQQQPTRQQRPAQQQPTRQQRPAQQQPTRQQRPVQQRSRAVDPEPWRGSSSRGGRTVAVEPEGYRSRTSRGARKGNGLLIVLVIVLVLGVVVSGVMLGSALLNYHRDRSAYNSLADDALSNMAEPNATPLPGQSEDTGTEQQQVQSEVPFAVNWDYLRSVNSDVVGWIYCEGTQINYPVVQTVDNEYYLHRDFTTKQPNTVGTLFADPNSGLGVTYSNYIIYGHNMKDGSMFAAIEHYSSQDFYNEHPVMYFLTPDQNYRIDLIAGRIVESTLDNYPSYFGDGNYGSYLNDITSHSFFATHANVSTSNQLITLSTCDYSGGYRDPRFLLQGLLVPIQ